MAEYSIGIFCFPDKNSPLHWKSRNDTKIKKISLKNNKPLRLRVWFLSFAYKLQHILDSKHMNKEYIYDVTFVNLLVTSYVSLRSVWKGTGNVYNNALRALMHLPVLYLVDTSINRKIK